MKDFLINKDKVNFSAYITDINPNVITTNGALTIVDNTDLDKHINGLVHNSYSIFLDSLFLASGYGFSSYNDFSKAAYLINTYSDSYRYLLDQIENFKDTTFELKYTYDDNENNLDNIYNTYGCLTSYKYITVSNDLEDTNSYIISLNKYNTKYIENIQFKLTENIDANENIINYKDDNYIKIGESIHVCYIFSLYNNNGTIEEIKETSPEFYINNQLINLEDGLQNNNNEIIVRSSLVYNQYHTEDLNFVCKRNNDIIYSYFYKDFIKWRYRMLVFNTNTLSMLLSSSSSNLSNIYNFDKYDFDDSDFNLNSTDPLFVNALTNFLTFINDNFETHSKFLDDSVNIEFIGDGYFYNDEWIYMHDYIVLDYNTDNLDFYFNNILNNGWKRITINNNGQIYKIFQSPKRYMGKHIWNIRYRNE